MTTNTTDTRVDKLDPETFTLTREADGRTRIDYGLGTVTLEADQDADAFVATLAKEGAKTHAALRLPRMPANRRAPDAGKPADAATLATRFGKATKPVDERTAEHAGMFLARPSGLRIVSTDGHAARIEAADQAPDAKRSKIQVDPKAPIRLRFTPEFWQAYSRVRTCRSSRSHVIYLALSEEGVTISTSDLDSFGGHVEARETVPGCAGMATGPNLTDDLYRTALSDKYLWPLRGLVGTLRQTDPFAPAWIASDDGKTQALVMPMNDGTAPTHTVTTDVSASMPAAPAEAPAPAPTVAPAPEPVPVAPAAADVDEARERRRAAARKAWETMRAKGIRPQARATRRPSTSRSAAALKAWETRRAHLLRLQRETDSRTAA